MYISQKQTYTRRVDPNVKVDNLSHMKDIANMLGTYLKAIERKRESYIEKVYVIRTDKLESKKKLFSYLDCFPLFGYKYFAHINLKLIHDLALQKKHKTNIKLLKKHSFLMKINGKKSN